MALRSQFQAFIDQEIAASGGARSVVVEVSATATGEVLGHLAWTNGGRVSAGLELNANLRKPEASSLGLRVVFRG